MRVDPLSIEIQHSCPPRDKSSLAANTASSLWPTQEKTLASRSTDTLHSYPVSSDQVLNIHSASGKSTGNGCRWLSLVHCCQVLMAEGSEGSSPRVGGHTHCSAAEGSNCWDSKSNNATSTRAKASLQCAEKAQLQSTTHTIDNSLRDSKGYLLLDVKYTKERRLTVKASK